MTHSRFQATMPSHKLSCCLETFLRRWQHKTELRAVTNVQHGMPVERSRPLHVAHSQACHGVHVVHFSGSSPIDVFPGQSPPMVDSFPRRLHTSCISCLESPLDCPYPLYSLTPISKVTGSSTHQLNLQSPHQCSQHRYEDLNTSHAVSSP